MATKKENKTKLPHKIPQTMAWGVAATKAAGDGGHEIFK